MTHRPIQPPPPPDLSEVPRLQVQRGERSLRARGRNFAGFSVAVMSTSLWAGLWGFYVPPSVPGLLCLALPGAGIGLLACGYFALPLVDDVTRFVLYLLSARQEIQLRADTVYASIDRAQAHAGHWYRARRDKPRVIIHNAPAASPDISPAGDKARIPAASRPEPTWTATEPTSEHETQQLPELLPPPDPVVYVGTPVWVIMEAAFTGQKVSVAALTGAGKLNRKDHAAAMEQLIALEIMVNEGPGRGCQLTPAWARYIGSPQVGHSEVARLLGAREG